MDYLDFELEIGAGAGREYPVRVINSPAGQARETMRFPFGELELQNKLQALQIALLRSGGQHRQSLSPEQQTVQDFGCKLFDALLTGEARVRYDVSLRDTTLQGRSLRIKLRINTPEMAALPWEYLYDPRRAEYVCLSQDTPIVRYLELPQPIQPLTVTPPLRVLGMVASPSDLGSLNVDLEKQRVEDALRGLQAAGLVELTWLEGQTWRALQETMRRSEWHIFHFIGHGSFDATTDEGLVMLCGEDGKAQRMSATQLGRLLANHRTLRLVLLNACEGAKGSTHDLFSSTASILVRRGIPAVLAMQYAITDRAAIEFARTFYASLVDGLPVDAAVVESRVAISMAVNNTVEWGTPVLFMRSPDGVLFRKQETRQETSRVAKSREEKQTTEEEPTSDQLQESVGCPVILEHNGAQRDSTLSPVMTQPTVMLQAPESMPTETPPQESPRQDHTMQLARLYERLKAAARQDWSKVSQAWLKPVGIGLVVVVLLGVLIGILGPPLREVFFAAPTLTPMPTPTRRPLTNTPKPTPTLTPTPVIGPTATQESGEAAAGMGSEATPTPASRVRRTPTPVPTLPVATMSTPRPTAGTSETTERYPDTGLGEIALCAATLLLIGVFFTLRRLRRT